MNRRHDQTLRYNECLNYACSFYTPKGMQHVTSYRKWRKWAGEIENKDPKGVEILDKGQMEEVEAGENSKNPVAVKNKKKGNSIKLNRRAKHTCPYPSCSSVVVHLPRHMRKKHKWNKKDAGGVLNTFGLRSEKKKTSGKPKREFKSMVCPLDECQTVVRRLHNHLTDVHKMKRGSEIYKKYLASAVQHKVVVISSSESHSSSSEEDEIVVCKKIKEEKRQKYETFFEKVHPSSDEDDPDYPENVQSEVREDTGEASTSSHSSANQELCQEMEEVQAGEIENKDPKGVEILGKGQMEEVEAGENSKNPVAVKNKKKGNYKLNRRAKHTCPYPSCSAVVVHLPRHMRQKHKWNKKDAGGVLNTFGLRSEKKKTSGKPKREFKSMVCPLDECQAVVRRLHNHLTDVHKMKCGSEIYKKYLASTIQHEVVVIPSSESHSSSSEEDEMVVCKKIKEKKKKKYETFFEKVYPSSDEDDPDYPENVRSEVREDTGEASTSSHSSANQGLCQVNNDADDFESDDNGSLDGEDESDMEIEDDGPDDMEALLATTASRSRWWNKR